MGEKKQILFLEPGSAESFILKGIRIDQLLPREACEQFSAYMVRMEPFQIKKPSYHTVSYTHLTLPTILLV